MNEFNNKSLIVIFVKLNMINMFHLIVQTLNLMFIFSYFSGNNFFYSLLTLLIFIYVKGT